jgi:hypothetical protein
MQDAVVWVGVIDKLDCESLAVVTAANSLTTLTSIRIYPGNAVNDDEIADPISHGPSAFNEAPVAALSSFVPVPCHFVFISKQVLRDYGRPPAPIYH